MLQAGDVLLSFSSPRGAVGPGGFTLARVARLCVLIVLVVCLSGGASARADDCPNAAVRAQQDSTQLSDCRAWEKVSPDDKNGSGIYYHSSSVQAAIQGGKVKFRSNKAFGAPDGSPLLSDYIATRTPGGWSTRSISSAMDPDPLGAQVDFFWGFSWFTSDLAHGVFMAGQPAQVPGASPDVRNLYLRDVDGGSNELITPPPLSAADPLFDLYYQPVLADATGDGSHLVFESFQRLTEDAPPPTGEPNLYERVGGDTRLVGILPDGTPAGSSIAGGGAGGWLFGGTNTANYTGSSMSDDGSRVVFTANSAPSGTDRPRGGEIFVRENGATTIPVSASQRTDCAGDPTCGGDGEPDPAPDPAGPRPAFFMVASNDANAIFFQSCEKLTDESTATCDVEDTAFAAYRYEVATGELADLSAGLPDGTSVEGVIGASMDGSSLYFVAGVDASGLAIYLARENDLTQVAHVDSTDYAGSYRPNRSSQISKDGRFLVFVTEQPLTGVDNVGPTCEGRCAQVYLYDAELDVLSCVSCPAGGGSAPGASTISPLEVGNLGASRQYLPRVMDAAVSRVFFETAIPLVPEDVNGKVDVYQYNTASGEHTLVSSGTGNQDAHFGDSTADGRSVFFVTANRLVARDRDGNADLYVAQADGGFPESSGDEAFECQEDGCQGSASSQPASDGVGTASLIGAGSKGLGLRAQFNLLKPSPRQRLLLARGGKATIAIRVNGRGRVRVTGRARVGKVRRTVLSASRTARGQGLIEVPVSLSLAARRQLTRHGRLKVSLSVRFTGADRTRTLKLDLRRAK